MYLSRITLNRHRRTAWPLLTNRQRLHSAVLACFPQDLSTPTKGEPRLLWRLDSGPQRDILYVASPQSPDFTSLAEQAGWPQADPGHTRDYAPILAKATEGSTWAFRLTANPHHYQPKGERLVRAALLHEHDRLEWLTKQATKTGFTVDAAAITRDEVWKFNRGPNKVTIATAQFDGRLTITNPTQLRQAMLSGIGPAKGYGCGMLTIAHPTPN